MSAEHPAATTAVARLQNAMREQGRCPECGWRTGDGSTCASCYRALLEGARRES